LNPSENAKMSRLDKIQNWPELAHQSGWCVIVLARQCAVSPRTLERYFREQMRAPPKKWLAEQRQHEALKLLNEGFSVKETAFQLGYKHAAHFSRQFKKELGFCPTQVNTNNPQT
jgi:AraC family transcriptional regulator, arabinose operon regulatory protein